MKNYNYSSNGAYFITICTHNHECLFGKINDNSVNNSDIEKYEDILRLNNYGKTAENDLLNLPTHFSNLKIVKYIIMPNHIHFIVLIDNKKDTESLKKAPTLSTIIGLYKSGVSRQIGFSIWQKSFYDHIIRNDQEYQKIWEYIDINPLKWQEDCYHIK